ncbi:MAG: hypothetical protein JSU77_10550 [Fidelibacterota bacterium]|nr:MAG: hypothetical protein JSU77_10550 [Candidatus Neomarinimicrobiota bacterium]
MTTPTTTEPKSSTDLEQRRQLEHYFAQNFDSLAYPLLADIYLTEGDLARAHKVCTVGLDHHPGHPPGLFLLATMALREGNLEDAETLLLQTLSRDEYHLEAAELLVAVQERLRRKKSVLEQAYQRLLHANPLSRGARLRLRRLQAERELVRGVKDELREKRGVPADPEIEDTEADDLQTLEPPELEAEAAGPAEAPTAGETIADLSKADETEQAWEANIKRLAAMIAASSGRQEEAKPGEPPLSPEVTAEAEAPSTDTAAPSLHEPGVSIEQQGEILYALEAEEKIDEEPSAPGFEPAEEETGPEGEVLDTPALSGEGEVVGPFVSETTIRDDETGPEAESPFEIIPEGEKPEKEPFSPKPIPLGGEAALPEDEFVDTAALEDMAQQEQPFQLDVESLPRENEREDESVEAGPFEGILPEATDAGPIGEILDSESLLEGESEAEAEGIAISSKEGLTEAQEAFEPGTGHPEESTALEEDLEAVTKKDPAGEKESFEPGIAIASEEALSDDDDLSTGLPEGQEVAEEQVWPGATPADEGITKQETRLYEGAAEEERSAEELFEPGLISDREQVKPESDATDTPALESREQQEEPYRPDVESLQRATKHENEMVEAVALSEEDTVEHRPGAPTLQKEGNEEDLYKTKEEDKDTGKESFEPGIEPDREEEVKPEGEGTDLVASKGRKRQEEPHRPDVASLQRETDREDELTRSAILKDQDLDHEGAVPFDEMRDQKSTPEGEQEAVGGEVEIPLAESRMEEPEEFEPSARHLKEGVPPTEEIDTAPLDRSAEEEELFEPSEAIASEDALSVEDDLGRDLSEGREVTDEQVWRGAASTDYGRTGLEAGLGEETEERERPEEEPFEPGLESDLEQVMTGDEGNDTESLESREQEEPHQPDAEFLQRATQRENEMIKDAILAGEDTVEDQPVAAFIHKGGDEEDFYKIEEADKDTGQEPFEPGTKPDREEEVKPGDEGLDARVFDEQKREEPSRPDRAPLHRETKREDELAQAGILEDQDLEDVGDAAFSEMPKDESPPEGASEAVGGEVEAVPMEIKAEEKEVFEPGVGHPEERAVLEEDIEVVSPEDSTEEEEFFEPGEKTASEEVPPVEEDLGTGLPEVQQTAEEQVWSGADSIGEGITGLEAGLGEEAVERERPEEEPFEPGGEPSREEEVVPGEKDLDTTADESKDIREGPAWPEVPQLQEQVASESTPFEEAAMEEKDHTEEQVLPDELTDEKQTALGDEATGKVTLEDRDLEQESFEPGDQPLDKGYEAKLGEAALERQAVEGEEREEEPYRPDVDSLQKEAEQESEIIDKAVHDDREMAGDIFEPSSAPPKEEAPPALSAERDQKAVEEIESDIEDLDEEEYEFESEFQAAEEAGSRDTLGIDPKLATFTLATIYKVQGLYHQALQVLDLLETKGGDTDRIQAERESILQLMTTDTNLEPE